MKKYFIVLCTLLLTTGQLWAEMATLDPIVVTANRTIQPLSEVPSSISIITEEDIINSGSRTIAEALQLQAGLHVINNGPLGAVASLSIRGSEAAQVLVLIDGVRLNSAQNGQFDLSDLPVVLEQIERIEILRGPASSVYGANALGGVVQIITKQADQPLTTLSWKESRWNTRQLSVTTAQKIGSLHFRLGVSDDSSDGFRVNSALDQNRFDASVGIDLPNNFALNLSGYYLDKETGIPGSTSFPSSRAQQTNKNSLTTISLQGPLGNSNLKIQGNYQRQYNNYVDPDSWIPTDDTHIIKTRGLEIQDNITLGSSTILIGGEFRKDELDSTTAGDQDQNQLAFFGDISYRFTDTVKMNIGLRYDDHSDFDSQLSPKFGLLLNLSEKTNLRVSIAKAFRAPTLNDRYWPETFFAKGNRQLEPETATEYELALDHNFNRTDRISVSTFLRKVKDLIEWAPGADGKWQPTNLNKAEIYGTEISATYVPVEFVTLNSNYTYLHAINETTDEFIDTKPRHRINAAIDLGPWVKTKFRVQGNYVNYYKKPGRKTNSYTTVDLLLKRPFAFKHFDLEGSLGVKNLFDRDYEVNEGYPMPGQEIFATLTALF